VSWLNLGSLAGWVALAALAWAVGGFRRPVPWRTVIGAGGLMLLLGLVVFWLPPARVALIWINDGVLAALAAAGAGARFVFGPLALDPGQTTTAGEPSVGFILAAQVLPAVIFFAALMAMLYHLRLIQPVVRVFALAFHRTLRLSGAESLAGSSNIFVGVESVMTVRPYLEKMTRSELLTLMACGMSTVASTTMALYVLFLRGSFPLIAGHLVSASVLSIPAAALVSKLILPETGSPETAGRVPPIVDDDRQENTMAALTVGAWDGLRLAAGIATLLIAVLGLVALVNLGLGVIPTGEGPLSLGMILGWLFTPLAWLLGIEFQDMTEASRLLGSRLVVTEVVAYQELGTMAARNAVSPRTLVIVSYALCGFAHLASLGIFVGGISAIAPSRRADLAAIGIRALVAATLATLMTGALAGFYYHGEKGILGL